MTMRSNKAIVNAAGQTITTAGLAAGGALNPEQAKKFIQQTFEATPLSGLVRHELRSAKTGEIDKIGVGRRLLRKKTENTDDGYRSGVKHGKLEYACTPVRLPWEITEETLRENIEGSNYETIVTNLMTRQIGCDREDLCLNGDERSLAPLRPTLLATSSHTTRKSTSTPQPTPQTHSTQARPPSWVLSMTPTSSR